MKKYSLLIINSDNTNFDYSDFDYQSAKKSAWTEIDFDEISNILSYLIKNLNDGSFSDQDYYVISDNVNEILYLT